MPPSWPRKTLEIYQLRKIWDFDALLTRSGALEFLRSHTNIRGSMSLGTAVISRVDCNVEKLAFANNTRFDCLPYLGPRQ